MAQNSWILKGPKGSKYGFYDKKVPKSEKMQNDLFWDFSPFLRQGNLPGVLKGTFRSLAAKMGKSKKCHFLPLVVYIDRFFAGHFLLLFRFSPFLRLETEKTP